MGRPNCTVVGVLHGEIKHPVERTRDHHRAQQRAQAVDRRCIDAVEMLRLDHRVERDVVARLAGEALPRPEIECVARDQRHLVLGTGDDAARLGRPRHGRGAALDAPALALAAQGEPAVALDIG
jgi:hypothetical protein